MKIIVFGLGGRFEHERDDIFAKFEVVGCSDNNPDLWGKIYNGVKCIQPRMLNEFLSGNDAEILICTGGRFDIEIHEQLIQMLGIPKERILNNACYSLEELSSFALKNRYYDDSWKQLIIDPRIWSTYLQGTPSDPFSQGYHEHILDFYSFLSHKQYIPLNNEGYTPFTDELGEAFAAKRFMEAEEIIGHLNIKHEDRVIEMGCGFGFALEKLCALAKNVTALDASNGLIKYARNHLKKNGLNAKIVHGEFFDIERISGMFDVIYFESSAHHCPEFSRLLTILNHKLTQSGRMYFVSEPLPTDAQFPWHINTTSNEGIYQICVNGWFELYFREDFFEELLKKHGFRITNKFSTSVCSSNYEVMKNENHY